MVEQNKHDPCGGMVSNSGGCDHLRGEHPNNGPCEYKESTGPGLEEEDVCICPGFVERPADAPGDQRSGLSKLPRSQTSSGPNRPSPT